MTRAQIQQLDAEYEYALRAIRELEARRESWELGDDYAHTLLIVQASRLEQELGYTAIN